MQTISVIQKKGGVGKTTISVHLACEIKRMRPDLSVTVADADPQKSALSWLQRGEKKNKPFCAPECVAVAEDGSGNGLRQELENLKADIVIIDLPPAISTISLRAALYSDVMLVPVGPSQLDIEAAKEAIEVCKEAISLDKTKNFLLVPSRVRNGTTSSKELRSVLKVLGPLASSDICLRAALCDAATAGVGINTFAEGSPGHLEFLALAAQVLNAIKIQSKQKRRTKKRWEK